jgi:ubiquinone/menaquinone biosynthesis C-methylase UbiE
MASNVDPYNAMVEDRKRTLLNNLRGNVVEIGAGTGSNFAFYSSGVQWLGIDPNPAMFSHVKQEAQRRGMTVELCEGRSEALPVPTASVDAVVCTLVLCSVRDPSESLQEVLRVLKPNGQFVFIEHVAAARKTGLRRLQGIVRPVWRLWSAGCCPDRETWTTIECAGFSQVHIEHFKLGLWLVGPHIAGFAVK